MQQEGEVRLANRIPGVPVHPSAMAERLWRFFRSAHGGGEHVVVKDCNDMDAARRAARPRELANVLGCSTQTILRWCREGKIIAARLPGGIRIPAAEAERLIRLSETGRDG